MPEKIAPALTPEEWRARRFDFEYYGEVQLHSEGEIVVRDPINSPSILKGQERAKLAALALHGQPFGFTRRDVEMLRLLEQTLLADPTRCSFDKLWDGWKVSDLADRIEALLPPTPEKSP